MEKLKTIELCMSEHLIKCVREDNDLLEDGQMVIIETINDDGILTVNFVKVDENNIRNYFLSKGEFKDVDL